MLPILAGHSVPGSAGPGSTAAETTVPGAEPRVVAGLRRYAELGVTDALISLVGDTAEQARTLRLLGEITTSDRTPDTERA